MGALLRKRDWAPTPLGPVAGWPQSLRTAVDLVLACPLPMVLLWGRELVQFYNDGYDALIGHKNQDGLGQPTREGPQQVWHLNEPLYQRVWQGEAVTLTAQLFPIARRGYLEDAYFTLSYSPVRDESAAVAGILVTILETGARLEAEQTIRPERSFQQNQALTLSAAEHLPGAAVFVVGPDLRYQFAGGEALEAAGFTAERFVGRTLEEVLPPALVAEYTPRYKQVLAGEPFGHEHESHGRTYLTRGAPLRNAAGEIVAALAVSYDITGRRQAEEASRANEEKYRAELERQVRERTAELQQGRDLLKATMDSSLDMIQVFATVRDDRGEIVDFRWVLNNHTSESGYGEVRGQSLLERNPGVIEEGIFDAFKRVVETGEPVVAERHYVHEQFNGWFYQSAVKLGDGVATTTKDITEWKQAQEDLHRLKDEITQAKLRAIEQDLHGVANVVPDLLWYSEPDGSSPWHNHRWLEYTGQTFEQAIGWGWVDTIHPDDREGSVRRYREAVEQSKPLQQEHRIRRHDGEYRWFLVRAEPLRGEQGRATRTYGSATEIHDQRTALEALRRSDERFRTLAAAAPALIWQNNAGGENLFINQHFLDFTGKSAAEIRGEGWQTLVHPDDAEAYVAGYLAAVREQRAWQSRNRIRRHDGAWRWFENYAQPLFDHMGRYAGHVGVSTDITALVLSEQALRESQEQQAFLLRFSDVLREEPDAAAVSNRAIRMLSEQMQLDRCYITVYRVEDDRADFPYQVGNDKIPALPDTVRLSDFPDAFAQVRDRTVVIEDDLERQGLSKAEKRNSQRLGMRALLASTVRRGERNPVSSLVAVSGSPRRWTPGEIALVEEAAERTWVAIERARAEAVLRESEETLAADLANTELLRSLAERIVSKGSFATIYDEVLSATLAVAQGVAGTIQIYDPERKSLELIASKNFAPTITSYFQRVDASSRTACGIALKTGKRAFVDFTDEGADPGCRLLVDSGIRSALALPLVSRTGTPLGMLNAHWREASHRLTEKQLRFLDLIARQAADLIEQRHAESVLRESEEQFRRAIEEAPIPVIMHAEDGQVLQISRTWTELTGFRAEDIPSFEAWLNQAYGEGTDKVRSHMHQLFGDSQRTVDIKFPIRTRTGEERHWSFSASSPGTLRDGRRFIVGMALDITERQRAEAALRDSEERFRLLVDNVQEYALFQSNRDGRVISWNPGAERLFGYSASEIMGQHAALLLTPDDRKRDLFEEEIARVLRGEHEQDARWLQRKDGSQFWAQWITEPVRDETGELRGVAKVLRDETDRLRSDEALRKSLAEKEELLKEVHHRVKNNLQVITSLINLQASQVEDERVLALFDETRNRVYSIAAIHELIYRSASFASIELGEYARQLVPELVRFYGADGRVRVEVHSDGSQLELQRAVPFGLLLNELVSNSCKHAFPYGRSGTVAVSLNEQDNRILLEVADSGVGLPPGFDYRHASSLGLKLIHSVARQLDAVVDFGKGPGTTVKVSIPVRIGKGSRQ